MITEDYVSFETAKLLKEKGFNERTNMPHIDDYQRLVCYIPTLQMAMKWLREVHHIAISLYVFNRDLPVEEDNIIYTCDIATANMSSKEGHLRLAGSYEQVCEAAIKYCLENLI